MLPELPHGRRASYLERARQLNAMVMANQPVTANLVDAMVMVDSVRNGKVETHNRAALILLDSNFEIGLKEFIVTNKVAFPP